uniref:Large ribosomal subunit protein uL16c n=1 Tax=Trentepohlia odorata TaxID=2576626 RepID=A0A4Y5P3E7_9CHLO|nr:ribosomal protein L16 [Trentepohlia odorata]QCW57795.1 ribosomal protein L16 [Trentepohlia odorata]
MLIPKRTKFKKSFRGRMKGQASRGTTIAFGTYGIRAEEPSWITSRQIESCRRVLIRYVRKKGKLWIRIFPYKPVTIRPPESRMGTGKGNVEYWVFPVLPRKVLFELTGLDEFFARKAFRIASSKLPIQTRFVIRDSEKPIKPKKTTKSIKPTKPKKVITSIKPTIKVVRIIKKKVL